MRMRGVKRRKEELFGKWFEGVHWGSSRWCGSCDRKLNDGRKSFSVK